MVNAADTLKKLGVPFEAEVVSAHRTPLKLKDYALAARRRGLKVIIAGAGGAAHLPGMVAAMTSLPVMGVPVQSKTLDGIDSLLSIVQMPAGIPVHTFAIGRAGRRRGYRWCRRAAGVAPWLSASCPCDRGSGYRARPWSVRRDRYRAS